MWEGQKRVAKTIFAMHAGRKRVDLVHHRLTAAFGDRNVLVTFQFHQAQSVQSAKLNFCVSKYRG